MSNRMFRQFMLSAEPQMVNLFAKVSFGAAGAPTLVAASSKGIKSIARNSAGTYTITLGMNNPSVVETYPALMMVKHVFDESSNSGNAPASPDMYVVASAVSSVGTLQIRFDNAGTATDPASGEIVLLQLLLKNSTAP